jgi:hypothetical protein
MKRAKYSFFVSFARFMDKFVRRTNFWANYHNIKSVFKKFDFLPLTMF